MKMSSTNKHFMFKDGHFRSDKFPLNSLKLREDTFHKPYLLVFTPYMSQDTAVLESTRDILCSDSF